MIRRFVCRKERERNRNMIYKDFQGKKLSQLGMGAMRLPVLDGKYADIDQEQVQKMVDYAMEHGVNYYDTAWGYHEGNSETAMGKALSKHPRENFYLADKFPGYDLSNMDKVEEIFEEQLKKCGVDYFDFYLFHNVCELNIDDYLDESHGIADYLVQQKKNGRIKHLGFSVHGNSDTMKRFLDKYSDIIEFCQIQLNYIDWDFQKAGEKVEMCRELGIPVWVMEPLRGGMLAKLPGDKGEVIKEMRPEESQHAVAFRFLQSLPDVTMILSGMSEFDQMKDNIAIFEEDKALTPEERDKLFALAEDMLKDVVPCTACSYCTSHCPMELDIPTLIGHYNEHMFTGGGFRAPMALAALDKDKKPSACIGCKSCEAVCPQQIKIAEVMADFTEKLKTLPMDA